MDLEPLAKSALEASHPGLLAAFGAAAKYIHRLLRNPEERFGLIPFAANLFIAFFVGILIGSFMDPYLDSLDNKFLLECKYGIFMVCGVTALYLFDLIERAGEKLFGRWISTVTGQQSKPGSEE